MHTSNFAIAVVATHSQEKTFLRGMGGEIARYTKPEAKLQLSLLEEYPSRFTSYEMVDLGTE